jgi:hypothetical protein
MLLISCLLRQTKPYNRGAYAFAARDASSFFLNVRGKTMASTMVLPAYQKEFFLSSDVVSMLRVFLKHEVFTQRFKTLDIFPV